MINFFFLILVGIFVGIAAGYVGSFMVLKRMSLVGDALSHVALPGLAVALVLHISPMLGAFMALSLAVLGIWYLETKTELYPETLVGIFFTASLALGVLLTPEPDLLEALFGSLEKVNLIEGLVAVALSLVVIIVAKIISRKITLSVISEELAKSTGVKVSLINFVYLALVAVVVALGVRFIGTLLMGALVIIPAASAKNVASGINTYTLYAIFFGALSSLLGILGSHFLHYSSGPIVVLVSIAIFILTLLFKRKEKKC